MKIAIGCHVMWYEVEMVEEYVESLRQLVEQIPIDHRVNIYIDFYLNVSQHFEKMESTSVLQMVKDKFIGIVTLLYSTGVKVTYNVGDEMYFIGDYRRDFNDKYCTDIGSGSGLPGIVLAIIMKHKKSDMEFHLYEKSFHKSNFLREVSKKFELNTKIFQKNIFEQKDLTTDVIVARAFKPLPVVLDLANENFTKFKYIILYLGKKGKQILMESLSNWQFEYKEKKSLTNEDSFLIKINNLKKKI